MSKIKLTELTPKSSLVDVKPNKAAKVNGGMGIVDTFLALDNLNRYGSTYILGVGYVDSYSVVYDNYEPLSYLQ